MLSLQGTQSKVDLGCMEVRTKRNQGEERHKKRIKKASGLGAGLTGARKSAFSSGYFTS